jgi:hypothetical protein
VRCNVKNACCPRTNLRTPSILTMANSRCGSSAHRRFHVKPRTSIESMAITEELLSLHNACKIPRTGLVSARSSRPLSNVDKCHDIWLCAILVQSYGNQQHKCTTVDKDHGHMLPVPAAALTDSFMGETKDIDRKPSDRKA